MAARPTPGVAQGGLWTVPKANYSNETRNLLKGTNTLMSILYLILLMIRIKFLLCRNDARI